MHTKTNPLSATLAASLLFRAQRLTLADRKRFGNAAKRRLAMGILKHGYVTRSINDRPVAASLAELRTSAFNPDGSPIAPTQCEIMPGNVIELLGARKQLAERNFRPQYGRLSRKPTFDKAAVKRHFRRLNKSMLGRREYLEPIMPLAKGLRR
jgi:hypothetical protein